MRRKLAVNLISGGASTCLSVIKEELPGGILFGVTKTMAIIASSHDVSGIQNAKDVNFPEEHIYVVEKGPDFAGRILAVLDLYKPDFFHQLGWMPHMPEEVMDQYVGLNQHLGPGGKWMYGVRRVYAHMRFCQEVGRIMPIQVFCQFVDPVYDAGKIVHARNIDLNFARTPEENAEMLLPIEHEVQIDGRRAMLYSSIHSGMVDKPMNIALNKEEEEILLAMKKEAKGKYPRK